MSKELLLQIHNLQKERDDLLVLIDTLQTNLRAAVSHLSDEHVDLVTQVQSYKWCMNWRPGQD
jgi:hypothetical protein